MNMAQQTRWTGTVLGTGSRQEEEVRVVVGSRQQDPQIPSPNLTEVNLS
jgi:hypothetical protein